ncbi:MAG: hypothetical protein J5867_01990, partial [Prevotella sp.]|nr:hypothetical protein [Prevotella sp.]
MKKITNVAHDTKEVKSVLKSGKLPIAVFICLLMAYLFPLSAFGQEHSTEYFWGEVTLQVGEQKTIYIGDDFGYALDAPVYSNFWNSSNENCVRVVGSNQTKGYCVIEGVSATSSTKVTCQLSYKLSKDSYQWSVW